MADMPQAQIEAVLSNFNAYATASYSVHRVSVDSDMYRRLLHMKA
jgi:hypothetical protein